MDIGDRSEDKWLMLGMLKSPEILGIVLQKLSIQDFHENETSLRMAFLIGSRWRESNRTAVPYNIVLHMLENEILKNNLVNDAQALQFAEDLNWCYNPRQTEAALKEVKNHIMDLLTKLILDRKVRTAAAGLDKSQDILGTLTRLNQTVTKAALSKAIFIDPFAGDEPLLCEVKRVPWGVDFIDLVTSGGATAGETALVLAPSGGGKTLTNIQLATTAALNGLESMIITYEQGATPGITNRMYAFALGQPIPTLMGLGLESYRNNSALMAKYQAAKRRLQNKITIIDQNQAARDNIGGSGGAAEVGILIKQAQDNGKNIKYIGIDWLGPMVTNYMSARNINTSETTKIMSMTADELRKIGDTLGVNIFIYHQLGTDAAKGGPQRKPTAIDAHMCKTLHHYMDTVICIGNRDQESQLAWINAPKVRNGEPFTDMLIEMEGSMSRWSLVDRAQVNCDSMKRYDLSMDETDNTGDLMTRPNLKAVQTPYSESIRANLG